MLNFAYGSNLLTQRLHARVPQAKVVGVGRIPGWRFAINIRSADGSAKANAIKTGLKEDLLHGVLYELDESGKVTLDRFEDVGDTYRIETATAETDDGPREVYLYIGSESRAVEGLTPYDWYRGLILAGARQHALPGPFVSILERMATQVDPDGARATANWQLIPVGLR